MTELVLKEESYAIVGACFEVYKEKGCGFLEDVYQECLELEFTDQGIPFEAQKLHPLTCKGRPLSRTYRSDFWCFNQVIVEIKAVESLSDAHRSQVLNYLNATGAKLGLLVNFGHSPKLEWERIVR
ncbi:MAG: GxxExxY protein [Opitutaceae bacterium]|jgi:GxxExxY protein|nr:GxxExxY protein [Opitutaceae bacterium]